MVENFDNNSYFISVSESSTKETADKQEPESLIQETEKKKPKDVIIVDCFETAETIPYKPLDYHWFYTNTVLGKQTWIPMSNKDSKKIENVYQENLKTIKVLRAASKSQRNQLLNDSESKFVVLIKGGRFECDLIDLTKRPIYWNEKSPEIIRRCLWFYKENNEQIYVPYEEEYSQFLEKEYEHAIKTNIFHKRIDFKPLGQTSFDHEIEEPSTPTSTGEEAFVFHSTSIMQHFQQASMLDEFGNVSSDAKRPRIMKRGIIEVVEKIESDEIDEIDHVCFVVHGIGDGCDIRFRPIVECVDDFRDMSSYIIQSHFKPHIDSKKISGRIEFLPIYWHGELHGDGTGIDDRLKPLTLPSIPKLRQYSNSTILDVLFYTSPIYCQTIISKVGNELNRLHRMFMERNPNFKGDVSLAGHSLGSLIIFDILSHQHLNNEIDQSSKLKSNINMFEKNYKSLEEFLEILNLSQYKQVFEKEEITLESLHLLNESDLEKLGLPIGPRRILQEAFKKSAFKKEREEVEIKINNNLQAFKMQEMTKLNPISVKDSEENAYFKYGLAGTGQLLIKYPQLNFKVKSFFALGSPIGMFMTVRGIENLGCDFKFPSCESFFNIFHPFDPVAYRIEPLICNNKVFPPVLLPHHKGRKRLHLELKEGLTKVSEDIKQRMYGQITKAWTSITEFAKMPVANVPTTINEETKLIVETKEPSMTNSSSIDSNKMEFNEEETDINWGKLNKGRRIDYVLQERPIESFNEYLFAIASHACYWESEDTILLMTKEIYEINNLNDANIELKISNESTMSWLDRQWDSNVKKTFSYFNLSLPQSITSVLGSTTASTLSACSTTSTASNIQTEQETIQKT